MARLIVTEFVSLDGVMEAPGGEVGYAHSGWVGDYFSDELGAYKQEEQLAADVLLLGRKTYESFYGAWPQREGPFAEKINTMPKYVASTTLSSLEWQTATLLRGPVPEAVAELKERETGSILIAGSRDAGSFPACCGISRPNQSTDLPAHPWQRFSVLSRDRQSESAYLDVVDHRCQRRTATEVRGVCGFQVIR